MSGWIKIYRDITDHWIFQDAEKFKWWVDMILMASHENHKNLINGSLVSLNKGQFSASISFLASRWGRSKEKVLNFLKLLESDHMITRNSDRKSTIITICNYESYQDTPEPTPTTEPTDVRPISDQSPTEYKNGKNGEEIYNNNSNAHTREDDFIRQYKEEGLWMDVALILHVKSLEDCKRLFDEFVVESRHKGNTHRDYKDFKRHFIQWARIAITKQPAQAQEKPKRVSTNEDHYRLMQEMGWESN